MALNGEMELKAQDFKSRALKGELSIEEMREWIALVRTGSAAASKTSSRSRAAKAPVDTAALMDELDNLE